MGVGEVFHPMFISFYLKNNKLCNQIHLYEDVDLQIGPLSVLESRLEHYNIMEGEMFSTKSFKVLLMLYNKKYDLLHAINITGRVLDY